VYEYICTLGVGVCIIFFPTLGASVCVVCQV